MLPRKVAMSGGSPGAGTGRAASALAVTLMVALLLSGCGQGEVVTAGGSTGPRSGNTAGAGGMADAGGTGCPEPGSAVPIAHDAEPTAVLRCDGALSTITGDGEWSVTVHHVQLGARCSTWSRHCGWVRTTQRRDMHRGAEEAHRRRLESRRDRWTSPHRRLLREDPHRGRRRLSGPGMGRRLADAR